MKTIFTLIGCMFGWMAARLVIGIGWAISGWIGYRIFMYLATPGLIL